jgi:hypothetical protein
MTRFHLAALNPRLGLAIDERVAFGVLIGGDRVLRQAAVDVASVTSLQDAISHILKKLSVRHIQRFPVNVAVGGRFVQLRHLTRLPMVTDARALTRLVRANPSRFFVQNAGRLIIPTVRVRGPGDCDAVAIQESVLLALVRACRLGRARLKLVIPAPRIRSEASAVLRRDCQTLKRQLGSDGEQFVEAITAARWTESGNLVVRAQDLRSLDPQPVAAWRLIAAGLVCVASLATAVLAPVLSSRYQARTAQRTLRILRDSATVAQRTEFELSAVSSQLEALQAFAAQRRFMTLLLADLTRALPSDVSLTSLRVDGDGGALTALAPRGGAVISDLQDARMITSPTVVGSVTAEGSGSNRLERVSVRFRWIGVSLQKRRAAARGDL